MCKHVAATLNGIGARLDSALELLFGLRKVDAKELIARAGEGGAPVQKLPGAGRILDSSKPDHLGLHLMQSMTNMQSLINGGEYGEHNHPGHR
jgi:hypothetical protein